MGRYLGPKVRIIRRLGLLAGLTPKMPKMRLNTPGEHGQLIREKENQSSLKDDYKERLIEKQRLRFNYGITEGQLIQYCKLAKKGHNFAGRKLLELLEARLDCVVYRLGFAISIPSARQTISHGHILVNARCVNIPSFSCQKGDTISVKNKPTSTSLIEKRVLAQVEINNAIERRAEEINADISSFRWSLPSHLELSSVYVGKVLNVVNRDEVLIEVNDLKVIEYYSK